MIDSHRSLFGRHGMRGSFQKRSVCDGRLLVLCIEPCADDTGYRLQFQALALSGLVNDCPSLHGLSQHK